MRAPAAAGEFLPRRDDSGSRQLEASEVSDQLLRVDGLGQQLEFVAVQACFAEQLSGGGLTGEENDVGGGQFLAQRMPRSMPDIRGIRTSLRTMSGQKSGATARASSAEKA